jgi:hypothetical protein
LLAAFEIFALVKLFCFRAINNIPKTKVPRAFVMALLCHCGAACKRLMVLRSLHKTWQINLLALADDRQVPEKIQT